MIGRLFGLLHVRRRRARILAITREIDARLAIRRSRRAERQAAARKGWDIRRNHDQQFGAPAAGARESG